jgi:hypothetical protein
MKIGEMMNWMEVSSQCFIIVYCLFSLAIIVEYFMIRRENKYINLF